jgi:hypothetical protein
MEGGAVKKEILQMKREGCLACGAIPVEICHIRSRGAGGPDEAWNVIPMCVRHHRAQHALGWSALFQVFPKLKREIIAKGWEFIETFGIEKAWHPKLRPHD